MASLHTVAKRLGVNMDPRLQGQMKSESSSPEVGYEVTREILSHGVPFTALFAFNDTSAIGAIHALRESGRRDPQDVSVIGFDDIRVLPIKIPVSQPFTSLCGRWA